MLPPMSRLLNVSLLLVSLVGLIGCATAWQMDYGTPQAQFLAQDVARLGAPYIGKKVTIKGRVTRIDTRDPKAAWVELNNGVRCNFETWKLMAEDRPVGSQVFVDGVLRHCKPDDILIAPTLYRDPSAPFSPKQTPDS